MRRLLKTSFKTIAYGLFFLVALAWFVYRTLPLDQVQAYLVRKAADEHNLDLEITELHTAGVAGLEMSGVMLRPRPTAEEREVLGRARERRRQWDASQAEKKKAEGETPEAATEVEGDDKIAKAAASKPAKGAKGKPDAAAESAAEVKPEDEAAVAEGDAKDPKAAAGKGNAAKAKLAEAKARADADDLPPPLPAGPQPMFIDRVSVKVNPLKLIMGNLSASMEIEALGGQATADLARDGQGVRINAEWSGMALAQLPVLRSKVGLPFAGDLGGKIALTVPTDVEGNGLDMANVTGEVDLAVTAGQLGPAKTVPQGSALHDALAAAMFVGMPADQIPAEIESDLPSIRFSKLGGQILFEGGKALLKDFVIEGPDVVGDIVGHLVLASQFSKWAPRLHQRFKFTEEFLAVKENQTLQAMLQGAAKVRMATDPEGFVGIQYTGFITQPKPSFTKYNSVRPRPRPGAGGAAAEPRDAGAAAARVTKGRATAAERSARFPGAGRAAMGGSKVAEPATDTTTDTVTDTTAGRAEPLPAFEPPPPTPVIDPSVAAPGEPIIDVPEPIELPEPVDIVEEVPVANPDEPTNGEGDGTGNGGDEVQPGDGDNGE